MCVSDLTVYQLLSDLPRRDLLPDRLAMILTAYQHMDDVSRQRWTLYTAEKTPEAKRQAETSLSLGFQRPASFRRCVESISVARHSMC